MPQKSRHIQVLVLLENNAIADQLVAEFSKMENDLEVTFARNQKDFIKKAIRYEPHIVICDMHLKDYDATEAYNDLRKIRPFAFFILVGDEFTKEQSHTFEFMGIDAFIPPGNFKLLELIIRQGYNRKHLEETVYLSNKLQAESKDRLRSVFNHDQNAIFIIGYKFELIDLNPAAISFFSSKNADDLLGTDMQKFVVKKDLKKIRDAHASAFRGKKTAYECAFSVARKIARHASVNFVPIKNSDGEVIAVMMICKDMTDNYLLGEKIKYNEHRFYTLAENAPVGIFMNDSEGNCTYVNKKWIEYTGLSFEESMGKGWQRALHAGDRERVAKLVMDNRSKNLSFDIDFKVVHITGKQIGLHVKSSPVLDASGKQQGYVGTIISNDQAPFKFNDGNMYVREH